MYCNKLAVVNLNKKWKNHITVIAPVAYAVNLFTAVISYMYCNKLERLCSSSELKSKCDMPVLAFCNKLECLGLSVTFTLVLYLPASLEANPYSKLKWCFNTQHNDNQPNNI